jgi:CBS domain-containing protein
MDGTMTCCPFCGYENIPGEDFCEECGASLWSLHLPEPATEVERGLLRDRIAILQPRAPIVVEPEMPVLHAVRIMLDHKIGCVLVVKDARLLGIFSERDALLRLGDDPREWKDRPVSDFMTPNPQTLDMSAKVAFALQRMDQGGYRHVPIVDEQQRPIGIISVRDILRYLTERLAAPVC